MDVNRAMQNLKSYPLRKREGSENRGHNKYKRN